MTLAEGQNNLESVSQQTFSGIQVRTRAGGDWCAMDYITEQKFLVKGIYFLNHGQKTNFLIFWTKGIQCIDYSKR